jgi:hypothetical protein
VLASGGKDNPQINATKEFRLSRYSLLWRKTDPFSGGMPMIWFRIRKAKALDVDLRKTFERYGVVTMQMLLASTNYFFHQKQMKMARDVEPDLLSWLTEQYDRAERKETWMITMEAAVTLFVLVEVCLSIIGLVYKRCR